MPLENRRLKLRSQQIEGDTVLVLLVKDGENIHGLKCRIQRTLKQEWEVGRQILIHNGAVLPNTAEIGTLFPPHQAETEVALLLVLRGVSAVLRVSEIEGLEEIAVHHAETEPVQRENQEPQLHRPAQTRKLPQTISIVYKDDGERERIAVYRATEDRRYTLVPPQPSAVRSTAARKIAAMAYAFLRHLCWILLPCVFLLNNTMSKIDFAVLFSLVAAAYLYQNDLLPARFSDRLASLQLPRLRTNNPLVLFFATLFCFP
ncbi:MAG: uncharacterized protein A8A55_1256 [Amphiamblys sp. WSBS2006]|nr:MAG: uncharacterized protein A8A55_1256 [Amphiamblys sp. WSBS2006]